MPRIQVHRGRLKPTVVYMEYLGMGMTYKAFKILTGIRLAPGKPVVVDIKARRVKRKAQ